MVFGPRVQQLLGLGIAVLTSSCGSTGGFLEGYGAPETQATPARADPYEALLEDLSRGSAGDAEATERALRSAAQLAATDPTARHRAAQGAAILLKARDASFFSRLSALDQGTELLDPAVGETPGDPIVRYLRAVSTFPLPSIAGRADLAKQDLDWLVAQMESGSAELDPLFDERRRALVLCMRGVQAERDDEDGRARALFEAAIELAPDSAAAARARDELAGL